MLRRCSLSTSLAVDCLQLRGSGPNAMFKLGVEPLQLPGLAIKLREDPYLGAQHLRYHRHRNIVDRAHFVATKPVNIADLNGRDEDHRRLLEAGMLADHGGEFEAVQFRHAHVDQNDGDFVLEQIFERFAPGRGDDEIFSEFLQNNFIGEQLRRLIVDQKDVYLFDGPSSQLPISGVATCVWQEAVALC